MAASNHKPAIGIDLGTTFSCVSVFHNGMPEVIPNGEGNRVTPSIVAFTEKETIVGEGADLKMRTDPENTIYNAKRFIGRKFEDTVVQENLYRYPFKITKDESSRLCFGVNFLNKETTFLPEEVASTILGKLKRMAEEHLEDDVTDAVITVPAYFNDAQRQSTKDAGKLAGLNVIRIINEPTAAAMAYGLQNRAHNEKPINALVYDLGGGTFDVSVLEIDQEIIQVKATLGNTHLGGEDFNTKLVQHFKKQIFRKHQVDMTLHPRAERRLKSACEKIKRKLSEPNVKEADLELDALLPNNEDFCSSITRVQFEEICFELFESTMKTVEDVLTDSKLSKNDIDEVIIVGGSTRIPRIQEMLSSFFNNKQLNKSLNPDEAVACGAAVQAAILNRDQHTALNDIVLLDVIPLSLGVNVKEDITRVVIERNTMIPVQKTYNLRTSQHNQEGGIVHIVEGERAMTRDNTILGYINVKDIPPGPAGKERVEIIFDLDANGILNVSAIQKTSGKKDAITIDAKTSGRLTNQEIDRLVKKAEEMTDFDQVEENRVLSRNALETLCRNLELELKSKQCSASVEDKVDTYLNWLHENMEATEEVFAAKRKELLKDMKNFENLKHVNSDSMKRSHRISRSANMTSKTCIEAGNDILQNEIHSVDVLKTALEWFNKAYRIAKNKEKLVKMCFALEGIGRTYRMLVDLKMGDMDSSFSIDNQDIEIEYCIFGVGNLSFAIEWSQHRNWFTQKEMESIVEDMDHLSDVFFQNIVPNLYNQKKLTTITLFQQAMGKLARIEVNNWRKIMFKCINLHFQSISKEIENCLAKEDLKSAIYLLGEVRQPIEHALYLSSVTTDLSPDLYTVVDMYQIVDNYTANTSAQQEISLAVEILGNVNDVLDIDEKINMQLIALDHVTEAKNLSKDDLKLFCKAKLHEGKIYQYLFPTKEKAKHCYKELIDIAISQNYTNTIWYKEAIALFQQIKKEEEKQNAQPEKNKDAYLKELEMEVVMLKKAERMSNEEFVPFLFEKFPPKHKPGVKMPTVSQTHEVTKRAYVKLASYYHTDTIDTEKHGEKYKVLCEVIVKQVNKRYNDLKKMD